LYTPVLYCWAGKLGLQEADAADLVQEVFVQLQRKLPEFQYDAGKHSFRGWLRTLLVNKWRELHRRKMVPLHPTASLEQITCPDPLEVFSEQEYRAQLVHQALRLMQNDFQPSTWQACWGTVVEGRQPAEVAAALGISLRAVHLARARVLRRLREELEGLLE
jgi:RNA polymerase sigma-70 factor (ECF subfamily)